MKKIALVALALGTVMAITAYLAEINEWRGIREFMTMGFIGYIFIISATAYLLVSLLHRWSKDTDIYQPSK